MRQKQKQPQKRKQVHTPAKQKKVLPDLIKHFPYLQSQIARYETIGRMWNGTRPYMNQPVLYKYVVTRSVSASSISPGCDRISQNSVYDPEISYAGHQPDYYDFWSAIYGSYYVVGVKIKFDLVNTSTVPVTICLVPCVGTATLFSTLQDAQEAPYGYTKILGASGALSTHTFKRWSDLVPQYAQFTSSGNGSDSLDDIMYYRTPVNKQPTYECSWQLYYYPTDAISTVTMTYTVTVEYLTVMTDRVNSGPSIQKGSRPQRPVFQKEKGQLRSDIENSQSEEEFDDDLEAF